MENYEEKYKQALEKAKEFFNSQRTCFDINQLAKIFPELKESEDERIRQNLHKLLCAEISIGTFEKYGLTDDSVFDWIEKQAKQKPT